jgi:hypothetical protein
MVRWLKPGVNGRSVHSLPLNPAYIALKRFIPILVAAGVGFIATPSMCGSNNFVLLVRYAEGNLSTPGSGGIDAESFSPGWANCLDGIWLVAGRVQLSGANDDGD